MPDVSGSGGANVHLQNKHWWANVHTKNKLWGQMFRSHFQLGVGVGGGGGKCPFILFFMGVGGGGRGANVLGGQTSGDLQIYVRYAQGSSTSFVKHHNETHLKKKKKKKKKSYDETKQMAQWTNYYENRPIQIHRKIHRQKLKIFR